MGGKEGSRGYLYQAFASVLEALSDENDWNKIYIEFDTNNDKVDIALEEKNTIFKSIQVKSSQNQFEASSVKKWLLDIIKDDIGAKEIELFLIGECTKATNKFINSIRKYQNGNIDNTVKQTLEGFDTDLLENKKIDFISIPFNIEILEKIVRDSLHMYVSKNIPYITFDQIDFIASATIYDQLISSTHGKGVDRKIFDDELEKRIQLFIDKYTPKRESISITSFSRGAVQIEDETMCLNLLDKFEKRYLRKEYDWNNNIYLELKEFLSSHTNNKDAYKIYLDTHSSLAFAAGRILDSKSGINIFPMQKSANGIILWDIKPDCAIEYPNWNISNEIINENQFDTVLILNITRNIDTQVVEYINEKKLPVGRIINCKINGVDPKNFSIQDGNHASTLANSIYDSLTLRTTAERRAILHVFSAAPNAFMFYLGQISQGFGKCILYEYDFELRDSCSYTPSIKFID